MLIPYQFEPEYSEPDGSISGEYGSSDSDCDIEAVGYVDLHRMNITI